MSKNPSYVGQRRVGRGRRRSRPWLWWGKSALKMGLGLGLLGCSLVVCYYAYREIRTSSFFRLTQIEVTGNRTVPAEDVRFRSGLLELEGISLFDVDLKEVAERVRGDVRIRDARASRKLPNGVLISVEERVPVGWVGLDRLYGVDREGILMPPLEPSVMPDLPILTGLEDIGSFEVGDSLLSRWPRFKQAFILLDSLQQVDPGLLDAISEIRVNRSNEVVLWLVGHGTRVSIAKDGIRRALIGLQAVLDRLTVGGRPARSIDLRFKGQAVVRFE